MTTITDIVNRALQVCGTRTTVTDAELAGNTSNEAIQANLISDNIRRRLLRMAPWDCALKTANLVYITSTPGTPENTSPATTLWTPGQPPPPWAYEYQYPVDCLRACWIIATSNTGVANGVPITTATTGGVPNYGSGRPIVFKVQTDTFRPVTAAAVVAGGTGHAVGDLITLPIGPNTSPPIGAPAILKVTAAPGGVISTVSVINQIPGAAVAGGSYFLPQTNPIAQASTSGSGINATFNLTFGPAAPQRIILTNQEYATLVYVQDITDPNIMDDMFQTAYATVLGAALTMALVGDKNLAKLAVSEANAMIEQARVGDGNEGLLINDITPDWLRVRGIDNPSMYSGPDVGYDWGGLWPMYG